MLEVPIAPRDDAPFAAVLDPEDLARYRQAVGRARRRLEQRRLWHINSTPTGGGVAEILGTVLGYLRHAGIDARWLVIRADPAFFAITKRIHNRLHGEPGDGGALGDFEREHVVRVTEDNLARLRDLVRPGDVAFVHDPQPLGLVPALTRMGVEVVWTCHVGVDEPNELAREAWAFLRPFLDGARAFVFTRAAYVWEGIERDRVVILPPCIDAFSLKNVELDDAARDAILAAAGVLPARVPGDPVFRRGDGREGRVTHAADVRHVEPIPAEARLVVQVSRWDRLKDPVGVLQGFARHVERRDVHLVLAGPAPAAVADDPEAMEVLDEVEGAWEELPPDARRRAHLVNVPTVDVEENAVIVNALQRRADVVVQKSLAEGFGLTVTEAMWKRRPVVASRVGGIQDQIVDGEHGRLVDPRDLAAFGAAVEAVLADPDAASTLADAAHDRVRRSFLAPHYLARGLELLERLDG